MSARKNKQVRDRAMQKKRKKIMENGPGGGEKGRNKQTKQGRRAKRKR